MAVLVWGVRSPAALELCRQLKAAGLTVEGADFLRFPLGRFSRALHRYHRLPDPRHRNGEFRERAGRLLEQGYQAVFACNEELFWLADAFPQAGIWSDRELLRCVHRKDRFIEILGAAGLAAPETLAWADPRARAWDPRQMVVKPVYSRFGEDVFIAPSQERLARLRGDWIAQRRLSGPLLCSTGFAWRGQLVTACHYRSRWGVLRAGAEPGHSGAGVHFERLARPDLDADLARLVAYLGFTGPLGLDWIDTAAGAIAVECNPRWTSGIHLLDCRPVFQALGLCGPGPATGGRSFAQLGAAMLLAAGPPWADFWRNWWSTPDVVAAPGDPGPALGQLLSLAELGLRGWRRGMGLSRASTWDIEWNG